MVFTTHIFIFYFLPLFLVVYFGLPLRWRNLWITAGQLRVLRLVGAVVRLPDDVHHRDGLHLGQGDHAARGDATATEGGRRRLRGDEPEFPGVLQVLHVRRRDAEPVARSWSAPSGSTS